jgi:DNA-binding GntR family transcriptional regulator
MYTCDTQPVYERRVNAFMTIHLSDTIVEEMTQAEQAYTGLRNLVRAGHYPPGQVLSEVAVAEQLGVGRTPIREAVSRLAHEGLLVRMPKRGVMIKTLSAKDVRDLYEVRAALEAMCVRQAVVNMTDSSLDGLRGLIDSAAPKVAAGMTWQEYRDEDRRFHRTIWEAGDNQRAYDLLSASHDAAILDPWFHLIADMPGQSQRSISEHRAIVTALVSRDPKNAEDAIWQHYRSYQKQLAERLFGDTRGGEQNG